MCASHLGHLFTDQVAHEGLHLREQPLFGSCLVVARPKRVTQRIHVFGSLCFLILLDIIQSSMDIKHYINFIHFFKLSIFIMN